MKWILQVSLYVRISLLQNNRFSHCFLPWVWEAYLFTIITSVSAGEGWEAWDFQKNIYACAEWGGVEWLHTGNILIPELLENC